MYEKAMHDDSQFNKVISWIVSKYTVAGEPLSKSDIFISYKPIERSKKGKKIS